MTRTRLILNHFALASSPARRLALEAVEAAIAAVLPEALVPQALAREELLLPEEGVWVLGAGKAAVGMAASVEKQCRVRGGAVITVPNAAGPQPEQLVVLYGDHPSPGVRSIEATRRLLELADTVGPRDTVLWLISGGASALLCAPTQGLTLEEKQEATRLLMLAGATIDEINTVRKHLSLVKGGLLRKRLEPAKVITLALSDVPSGRLDVIGSGPTVADASTYEDALGVIETYGLRERMPAAVLSRLEAGAPRGGAPETPKSFEGGVAAVIGSPGTAAAAAAEAARKRPGVHAEVLTDQLAGEARSAAAMLGGIYRYWARARARPQVIVAAGETTVSVTGSGKGGRCQELAAALIPELDGLPGCAVVCAATDGQDYIPGTGGAIVDGETARLARAKGLRLQDYLRASDSYTLHQALGTLLKTRPTGTNVCDLVVAVLNAGSRSL